MDGDRVSALGASYGGYMINWIAGNWPDRFRCLVNHDGNLDEQMAYYNTEELWFPEWERGGTPWDRPEAYQKHNPINHVKMYLPRSSMPSRASLSLESTGNEASTPRSISMRS